MTAGPYLTTVERVNYTNDTSTTSPRGPISYETRGAGGTGTPSYGWITGSADKSFVDRIDYSNDTATTSPRGPLSAAGRYQKATGNANYGWVGGSGWPAKTTMDRIDYSNDTATAVVRGTLNTARYRHGATGNTTHGYWIAGQPGTLTSIERIDYSNDTVTATIVGPLNRNVENSMTCALSSQANALPQTFSQGYVGSYGAGYFAGGKTAGSGTEISNVYRIDYATDTAIASTRGPLTSSVYKPVSYTHLRAHET